MASTSTSADTFERCASWLGERGGDRVTAMSGRGGVRCGFVRGGAVIGAARGDRAHLAYLGHLALPLPGRVARSPLDAPDETAAYLLERYRELGESFLDGVAGHFVVALVDDQRLILARDPSGQRRVFVRRDPGALAFSTTLSDFRGLLGANLAVDRSREDFLLGYEFLPDDRTLYEGVRVLPSGTILVWDDGRIDNRAIEPPRCWTDLPSEQRLAELPGETREEPVIELLGDAFMRAVQELVPSSDTVGVLLGGFDSALVVSALARLGKKVETFSFQYADARYNQSHVEELAALFGVQHNWVAITPEVMRDGLAHFAERFNQPISQPHYVIATARAVDAARQRGVRHLLSGDGCDGLFLGYPTVHQRAVLIEALSRVAPGLLSRLAPLARSAFLERRIGQPYRLARNVLTILERPMPARGHIAACTLDGFALEQLRHEPPPPQAEDVETTLARLARGLEGMSPLRLAYRGKSAVGLNRVKLEGSSAQTGVTIHSPFLHPGMARLARALPERMSRPDKKTRSESTGKYALMRMAETREMLPPEIIYQAKRSPVTAPVDRWYARELRSFMLEQLEHLPFEIDNRYARSLLSYKLPEEAFRKFVGISRYAFNAVSLLVTYASFCQFAGKTENP
jgi:asparagine synthetase B (glutamine-hydrolysing)